MRKYRSPDGSLRSLILGREIRACRRRGLGGAVAQPEALPRVFFLLMALGASWGSFGVFWPLPVRGDSFGDGSGTHFCAPLEAHCDRKKY